ncbi:MAG: hypothetical protein ABI700_11925 [Chloroflexota bacterium]
MRARLAPFKPVFILLLLIAILIVALVAVNLRGAPATTQASLDFQTLARETGVKIADYQLEYHNHSLDLRNTLTQAVANLIEGYDPSAAPLAYASLRLADRTYLITRIASGGSSGAYRFRVIRLDPDQGDDLTALTDNPNIGLSCSNPRLDGGALIFEISLPCAAGASVHDATYQTYRIPLH